MELKNIAAFPMTPGTVEADEQEMQPRKGFHHSNHAVFSRSQSCLHLLEKILSNVLRQTECCSPFK